MKRICKNYGIWTYIMVKYSTGFYMFKNIKSEKRGCLCWLNALKALQIAIILY